MDAKKQEQVDTPIAASSMSHRKRALEASSESHSGVAIMMKAPKTNAKAVRQSVSSPELIETQGKIVDPLTDNMGRLPAKEIKKEGPTPSNSSKRINRRVQTSVSMPPRIPIDVLPGIKVSLQHRPQNAHTSRPPAYLLQQAESSTKTGRSTADEDWFHIDKDSTESALLAHSQINLAEYSGPELDQCLRSIYSNLSYLVQTLQPKGWKWPENRTRFEFLSRCNFREFSKSIFMMQSRIRTECKENTAQVGHVKKMMSAYLERQAIPPGSDPVRAFEEYLERRRQGKQTEGDS
eukprot:TRINITY_DN7651_c0_g1_i2.p1 TRINITY_DN7651_c0_g1~~TRINITY_DN7651_c0_g1_i2.p1  ORF type:complete len:293 (+),score=57.21 TRINITY_DN7651_c0_g1_i2:110-988(+)